MLKVSASEIFGVDGQKVLIFDANQTLVAIEPLENHDAASIKFCKGALVPGFVNTHCHLELSHMKGIIPTGTGLIEFVKGVVSLRAVERSAILDAIKAADEEMYRNGIVAVGDISNQTDTFETKLNSKLHYHTFIEFFDLNSPAMTKVEYEKYNEVFSQHPVADHLNHTAVPHASYSVSPALFEKVNALNKNRSGIVSIHNQETAAEQAYFLEGKSTFIDLFESFGLDLSHVKATGQTAIHYPMKHMDASKPCLFVHNTLTSEADIQAAQAWNDAVYFATCPNANLYIENSLPNYQYFRNQDAKVTIGTDSLTSNWQLDILEEIKTIKKYQSSIPLTEIVTWATQNGAEALGLSDKLGRFEVGTKPSALDIEGLRFSEDTLDQKASVVRLV